MTPAVEHRAPAGKADREQRSERGKPTHRDPPTDRPASRNPVLHDCRTPAHPIATSGTVETPSEAMLNVDGPGGPAGGPPDKPADKPAREQTPRRPRSIAGAREVQRAW